MFKLTVFPGEDGDCFIVSYGEGDKLAHMLVDGGRSSAWRFLRPSLAEIAARGEKLELLVCTHIDADHIEGLLKLVSDPDIPLKPERVWFNGYLALQNIETLGERQGEELSAKLEALGWPVNPGFDNKPVTVEARPEPFDVGGLEITLLSPDAAHLKDLRRRWDNWRAKQANLRPMPVPANSPTRQSAGGIEVLGRSAMPKELDVDKLKGPSPIDDEPPNGSSIAFIARHGERSILLAGDAHPDLLATILERHADTDTGKVRVDLFKVSHHGSRGNTTRELIERLDCRRFILSSNGTRHGHPDPEAIARLLAFSGAGTKTLYFNYATERTSPWDDAALKEGHDYVTVFASGEPFSIDI